MDSRGPDRAEAHTCHARGCQRACHAKYLMCYRHWRMVPPKIQEKVWKHYRPFQELDKNFSKKWLKWANRAIEAVAEKEAA